MGLGGASRCDLGGTAGPPRREVFRVSNIEPLERVIRIAIGVALLLAIVVLHNPWRWAGLVGLAPLATGLLGWCPLYAWLARD